MFPVRFYIRFIILTVKQILLSYWVDFNRDTESVETQDNKLLHKSFKKLFTNSSKIHNLVTLDSIFYIIVKKKYLLTVQKYKTW